MIRYKSLLIKGILILLCVYFHTDLKAQTPDKFTKDSVIFFDEMDSYLSNARKEGKDFMKQFEEVWFGGYFSENQRQGVYEVTNIMLDKKFRAFPDFRNYLFTVGSFVVDENQTDESFKAWQGIILQLLQDKRKREFTEFLEFCNGLFRENAIYISASTVWAADNSQYIFGYDSLPKISFEKLDLICYAKRDSMKIYNTRGAYYPTIEVWKGSGGVVKWERAGLDEDKVYAEINNYSISTKLSDYRFDSVLFYNKNYFSRALSGALTNKLLANMSEEKASYPRFDSYDKRISIQNITPGVNFAGGFSMIGSKILGKGDEEQDAIVEFVRRDTVFLRAYSENFSIRPDKITSVQAAVNIYLMQDSIYHPGLNFKYLFEDKLVTLYKDGEGISKTPYYNSFHDIEMDFEVLNWKTDEPIMKFTKLLGSTKNDARFTSSDYFKKELYNKLGGEENMNPMNIIYNMSNEYGNDKLPLKNLSYKLNMDPRDVRNLMVIYSTFGLVDFDFDNDIVIVKEKLNSYIMASRNKIDYDVININSTVDGSENAKMNLLNYDLSIYGIRGIVLSDSQQVVILPSNGEIKMKRNRFFEFGGRIQSGRLNFYGKEFSFDYEAFKINLINVDSLQMRAESKELDSRGKPIIKTVRTVIQDVNGDLLIDNFGNKSGIKDYSEYPIFNSKKESYVYYDKKEILDGVYKKSNFYFQLEPFKIDSLNNFSNDQLNFNGTFASADIFPEFKEKLTLQEDFSLGFIRATPAGGFPMYKGKGKFFNDIKLSHEGLRGDGKLEYITSTTYSKDFIFYPDSMLTKADQYFVDKVEKGVEYPPVKAEFTNMRWLPKKDVLYATTTESGMIMYEDVSEFEGTTSYGPNEMSGDGTYHFERADLSSNQFVFKSITFDADTSAFQLKDIENTGTFALKTANVKAHIDYKKRFGNFKANGEAVPIEFPQNQYLCFMEAFKWYMDDGAIDLTSTKSTQVSADVKLEGSKFISTNQKQDSLFFFSPLARYDSRKHTITAQKVKFINSADARVYPDEGEVVIRKKAAMDTLKNSKIVANSITEYHTVYNANTSIKGRKNYTSSGYIDYIDDAGSSQTILLQNIVVDSSGQTFGQGDIADSITFVLSSQFAFDGKVKLFGSREFLVFDGVTKINHECQGLEKRWIDFEAEIDPNNIFIPIDTTLRDSSGAFISSSFNLNVDSVFLYTGFLTKRQNYSDIPVLASYGFLQYDKSSKQYRIGAKEKLAESSLAGNLLTLNTENCKVYGEGVVDIGARAGNLKFNSAGIINNDRADSSYVLDLMMTVDFFFEDNALKKMASELNENINLKPVDFSRATYEKALKEIVGQEQADEIISQLSLNGKIKRFPDELDKRIVFSDVKFKWDEENNSFVSFGPLGITNINKTEINKYVGGGISITKKRSGDIINIYLEIDSDNWYFFSYRRGLMKVISTNEAFNEQIRELKRDKRRYPNEKGEEPFTFMYGNEKEMRDFKRDFDF